MNRPLNINEVFASIDGEVNYWGQGFPTIFIRLAGCNLNCPYCDTEYAQDETNGVIYSPENLKIFLLKEFPGFKKITITGGEPLLQADNLYNFIELVQNIYHISIETNGSIRIPDEYVLFENISWIIDCKMPSAFPTTEDWFIYYNKFLRNKFYEFRVKGKDYIKFVISNKADFQKAVIVKETLKSLSNDLFNFVFSPELEKGNIANIETLFEMMKSNKILDSNLNIQIHKLINMR